MTRDEIIRLAREAGYGEAMSELHAPALERFATLIAAAEREACAKKWEDQNGFDAHRMARFIRSGGEQ